MTHSVIEMQGLTKTFDGPPVLNQVDLSITAGQVVGLIGMNGSGKTTLIKCLLGLLRPSAGSGQIYGDDSQDLSAQTKARLGYVSQEFELLPWMTVQELCDYTGAFYDTWDAAHVARLVSDWNLDAKQRVGTLSVGQRQKLAVILALGHRPELLILDEPVASLDPFARRQFLDSLVQFTDSPRNTVLFSTHITSDLERIASHVAILRDGRLTWFGPLDELKDNCKRLRLHAARSLPSDLHVPGAIRTVVTGQHAVISVAQFDESLVRRLHDEWNADVQIEDLNLEEIFLEWNDDAPAVTPAATETL